MKRILLASFLALFLVFGPTTAVFAKDLDKPKETGFFVKEGWELLGSLKGALSGPAWLMIEKLNPGGSRLAETPGQNSTFQAAGLMGLVPYRSPAPAFSRNLLVTRDLGTPVQTEPHIAVNPRDPDHLVLTSIDYALPYNAVYVSFNRGENWQGPNRVPLPQGAFYAGDPVLAFDRQGRVYQVSMAVGAQYYGIGPFYVYLPTSDIAVSMSEDGGINWPKTVVAARDEVGAQIAQDEGGRIRGRLVITFPDKPWISIGPDPANPGNDVIYITFTEFIYVFQIGYAGDLRFFEEVGITSVIRMTKSKDGGKTWAEPVEVSPVISIFNRQKEKEPIYVWVVQGSQVKVAQDGTIYVAWYDSTSDGIGRKKAQIYLISSPDGRAWTKPMVAAEFLEGPSRPTSASFRNPSYFPQLAAGPNKEVYIAFAAKTEEKPFDDGDIYFVRSLDAGETFEKPLKINQDKTDKLQFFPAITVGPKGKIHLMWGDMRDDPAGLKYHIYYTRSSDQGKNWGFELKDKGVKEPDTRVTDFPSNPNKAFPWGWFIGDYYAIAVSDKDVYLVWTDSRLGEYGSFNQKIGFARSRAIASPEVFLNPSKGPAGQEVSLQAFNFQPDLNLFVKTGGNTFAAGKANQDGGANYKFFVPMSSEGTHEVVVFDESGNTAVASFYTDFGFGNLKGGSSSASTSEMNNRQWYGYLTIAFTATTIVIILAVVLRARLRKRG